MIGCVIGGSVIGGCVIGCVMDFLPLNTFCSYLWSTDDHSTHRPEAKLLHPTLGPSANCKPGCLYRVLDGRVEGEWVDGLLHGSDVKWFYPDGRSTLRGKWNGGQMESAKYFPSVDKAASSASPNVFQSDFATTKKISSEPTLRDPYESACVAVGPSRVAHPNANEGFRSKSDCTNAFHGCTT